MGETQCKYHLKNFFHLDFNEKLFKGSGIDIGAPTHVFMSAAVARRAGCKT